MKAQSASEIHQKILQIVSEGQSLIECQPRDQTFQSHVELLKRTEYLEEIEDASADGTNRCGLRITHMGREYLKVFENSEKRKATSTKSPGHNQNKAPSGFKQIVATGRSCLKIAAPLLIGAFIRKLFSNKNENRRI